MAMERRSFLKRVFGGVGVLSLARVLPTVPTPLVVVPPVVPVLTPDPFAEMSMHVMSQTGCCFSFAPIEATCIGDHTKVFARGFVSGEKAKATQEKVDAWVRHEKPRSRGNVVD